MMVGVARPRKPLGPLIPLDDLKKVVAGLVDAPKPEPTKTPERKARKKIALSRSRKK